MNTTITNERSLANSKQNHQKKTYRDPNRMISQKLNRSWIRRHIPVICLNGVPSHFKNNKTIALILYKYVREKCKLIVSQGFLDLYFKQTIKSSTRMSQSLHECYRTRNKRRPDGSLLNHVQTFYWREGGTESEVSSLEIIQHNDHIREANPLDRDSSSLAMRKLYHSITCSYTVYQDVLLCLSLQC